jgi:hypothetical protein
MFELSFTLLRCYATMASTTNLDPTSLAILSCYLKNLPDALPVSGEKSTTRYDFQKWEISPDEIADYGEEGSVNRRLELAFGSREKGDLVLTERGPGLEAVVAVLEEQKHSAIMEKWVTDLTTAAKNVYVNSKVPVSCAFASLYENN